MLTVVFSALSFVFTANSGPEQIKEVSDPVYKTIVGHQKEVMWNAFKKANAGYKPGQTHDAKDVPSEIRKADSEWRRYAKKQGRTPASVNSVLNSKCSEVVKTIAESNSNVTEIIVVDKMGANICVSQLTSDYYQGDEAKFLVPIKQNINPFVDSLKKDKSTGKVQAQVSYKVEDEGHFLGVITIAVSRDVIAKN